MTKQKQLKSGEGYESDLSCWCWCKDLNKNIVLNIQITNIFHCKNVTISQYTRVNRNNQTSILFIVQSGDNATFSLSSLNRSCKLGPCGFFLRPPTATYTLRIRCMRNNLYELSENICPYVTTDHWPLLSLLIMEIHNRIQMSVTETPALHCDLATGPDWTGVIDI